MNENKVEDKIDYPVYLAVLSEREKYIAFAKNSIFTSQVFRCMCRCKRSEV